jgi:hypothetical protein
MTIKIRQEINLTNVEADVVDGVEAEYGFGGVVKIDPDDYNGKSAYFEILAKNANVSAKNCLLSTSSSAQRATSGYKSNPAIPGSTSTWTLIRSGIFTLDTVAIYYCYRVGTADDTDISIKLAKVIILQDAANIIDTVTQIEVGAYQSKVSAGATGTWYPLDEPKYWKYESAKFDPTPTFTFGITLACENDMDNIDVALEYDDGAFNWSGSVVGQISSLTSEDVAYYESSSFTPTDGLHYRVVWRTDDTKSGLDIYNAKVIINSDSAIIEVPYDSTASAGLLGGSGTNEMLGQSFTVGATDILCTTIKAFLAKWGSPTDNIYIEIATSDFDGSVITNGTSDVVAASSLVNIVGGVVFFNFSTPPTLAASTKYYMRLIRSGARDVSNYTSWFYNDDSYLANGGYSWKNSGSWDSESSTNDFVFSICESITKLQPEYLLINEAQADTGLQEYLIDWIPSFRMEWSKQ